MTIKDLKKGDFFRLKENGKVYVRDTYDRSEKRFGYYDFEDVNNYHFAKATKKVIADFIFW